MRPLFVSAVAASSLLLTACSGDDQGSEQTGAGADPAAQSTAAPSEDVVTQTDTATQTAPAAGPDDSTATSSSADAAEEQAAADRAKEFLVALANADPQLCELVVNFAGDAPMADSPEEVQICVEEFLPEVKGQMSEQEVAIMELVEIEGAQVNGDTATITADNFSEAFAVGFGDEEILLERLDGEWYVDIDNSFGG